MYTMFITILSILLLLNNFENIQSYQYKHIKNSIQYKSTKLYLTPVSKPLPNLQNTDVIQITTNQNVNLDNYIISNKIDKKLLILGTYAADFNTIEYAQRLNYYLPKLKEKGITKFYFILNASPNACIEIKNLLKIPEEVELFSDDKGKVGQLFQVSRGN